MKKFVTLFSIMVATLSMWAVPFEHDDMRFDRERQLEQGENQLPLFPIATMCNEATPPGGMTQEQQSLDKIHKTAAHVTLQAQKKLKLLGNVNQDKLRYGIYQYDNIDHPCAVLFGWVDSNDYYPELVVPDNITFDGQSVPVTSIADHAFYSGWGITGLTLGKNVESIGQYAFSYCSITKLSIPHSVNLIMNGAFSSCTLESIVFEDANNNENPLVIGSQAFAYTDIQSVEIPARLQIVDDYSFRSSRTNPFQGCLNLETITINPKYHDRDSKRNYTLEINQGALCERLESNETYPEFVYVIAYPAAKQLEEFSLTEPVIDIFTGAFQSSNINAITLCATSEPRTVEDKVSVNMFISPMAFIYSNMASLNISAKGPITTGTLFAGLCRNLVAYNFSESITNYKVFDGVLYAKKDRELYLVSYPTGRTNTSFSVPEDVLHLADCSFYSNWNIKEVTLPTDLKSLGLQAFYDCENLERINFNGNSLELIGDYSFDKTKVISSAPQGEVSVGNWLIGYSGEVPDNLVISNNITHSLPQIFSENLNITSVIFPENFENIPYGMFMDCRNLNNVQLPENLKTIGEFAFMYAGYDAPGNSRSEEVKTLTIPEGVTKIGTAAFDCSRLGDKLVLPSSLELLGEFSLGGFFSEVEIHRPTPPETEDNVTTIFLPSTLNYGKLIIPKDSDPLTFTQNPYWNFSKVINGDFASIDDIGVVQGKINFTDGTIYSTNGENFTLYATDGRVIGNGNAFSGLNPGIYIVHLGTSVQKYVIR